MGYESEAAFSRAFKKLVGEAPATWRRANVPGALSAPCQVRLLVSSAIAGPSSMPKLKC